MSSTKKVQFNASGNCNPVGGYRNAERASCDLSFDKALSVWQGRDRNLNHRKGVMLLYAGLIRAAIKILGARQVANRFHRSENLIQKWGNENPRQPDQSPNTDPITLMSEFLEFLAKNGGLKLAVQINRIFLDAISKEG